MRVRVVVEVVPRNIFITLNPHAMGITITCWQCRRYCFRCGARRGCCTWINRFITCCPNRAKIDDFIVIFGSINRAIYRDKIGQLDDFWRFLLLIFVTKSRLIVQTLAISTTRKHIQMLCISLDSWLWIHYSQKLDMERWETYQNFDDQSQMVKSIQHC